MDFLKNSQIASESNFELLSNFQDLNNNNNNINNNNNNIDNLGLKNSYFLLDDLTDSLNKKISDSVIDLTKCFICLSPTIDPLTCPKCNNFACKKCLEAYFGGATKKKCPLCKQDINYNELRENKIIKDIEEIINKDNTRKNKVEELSKLIHEKKLVWENQGNDLNNMVDKILKYQEKIKEYRSEYEIFFLRCKALIDKIFDEYEKKLNNLIESLFTFNKDIKQSIIQYDEINKKNKDNYYTNENIKSLINEILSLERKHFNEEHNNDLGKIFESPLFISPTISYYVITSIYIEKKKLGSFALSKKSYNVHLGDYELSYIINKNNIFSSLSKFNFTLKKSRNATFLITQKKYVNSKFIEIIPMKLKYNFGNNYQNEAVVGFDEFKDDKINKIEMEIKAQIFTINL